MKRDGRATAVLALVSAFLLFGFNTTETAAMPELVRSSGGGAFLAGAQNSFYVLLAVLLRPLFGPLADRRGARLVMAVGAVGFCGPCLALPFCHDPGLVVALHLMQSVGLAAYHPCVSSYLTALSAPDRLGRRLGALRFVTTAAAMLGPAALFPLIGAAGYPAFFGVLSLVALAGLACVLALPRLGAGSAAEGPASRPPSHGGAQAGGSALSGPGARPSVPDGATRRRPAFGATRWWRGLGRRQVMLLALPLLLGVGYSVVLNYGQALARASFPGMNEGLLFTVFGVGGLAGSVAAGRAFDAWGARCPVAVGLGCLAAGLALITQGWMGPAALLAGGALGGAGYYGANAACAAGVGALASAHRRSALFSVQQSCLDVGIVVGGLASATLVALGLPVPVVYLAMAALAMICLPVWGILHPREN